MREGPFGRVRISRTGCLHAHPQTHEHSSDDGVGNGAGGGGIGDGDGGGRGDGLRMREPMHHSSEGQQEREGHAHTALDGMQGSASSMGERIPFPTRMPKRKSPKARHLGESNPSSLEHCPRLGHQSGPDMLVCRLPRCSVNRNAVAASTRWATRARNAHHMNPRRTMLQDGASTVHCGASKLWRTIGNLGAN